MFLLNIKMDINKSSPNKIGKCCRVNIKFRKYYQDYLNLGPTPPAPVGDNDEPYPSLSDYHDYEPNLEFDDSELHQSPNTIAQTG